MMNTSMVLKKSHKMKKKRLSDARKKSPSKRNCRHLNIIHVRSKPYAQQYTTAQSCDRQL